MNDDENDYPDPNPKPAREPRLTEQSSATDLFLGYRKARAEAQEADHHYKRLIAENFDLEQQSSIVRLENSQLRDELRKLNCIRIFLESNPEASKETNKNTGLNTMLTLCAQMPDLTYEETEAIIARLTGALEGCFRVLGTKDNTIKIKRKNVKEVFEAIDAREKAAAEKSKPAKESKPRQVLTPTEKLARTLTYLPESQRLAVAEQMVAAAQASASKIQ